MFGSIMADLTYKTVQLKGSPVLSILPINCASKKWQTNDQHKNKVIEQNINQAQHLHNINRTVEDIVF